MRSPPFIVGDASTLAASDLMLAGKLVLGGRFFCSVERRVWAFLMLLATFKRLSELESSWEPLPSPGPEGRCYDSTIHLLTRCDVYTAGDMEKFLFRVCSTMLKFPFSSVPYIVLCWFSEIHLADIIQLKNAACMHVWSVDVSSGSDLPLLSVHLYSHWRPFLPFSRSTALLMLPNWVSLQVSVACSRLVRRLFNVCSVSLDQLLARF